MRSEKQNEDDKNLESVPLLEADDAAITSIKASEPLRINGGVSFGPNRYVSKDVFRLILEYLPLQALVASTGVNKQWHALLVDQERRWERKFALHFQEEYARLKRSKTAIFSWKEELEKQYRVAYNRLSPIQKRLFAYCKEPNLEGIRVLCPSLKLKDLTIGDSSGFDPLYYAARSGAADTLQVLYNQVMVPAYEANPRDIQLLHFAARAGQFDVIETLIVGGFSVNGVDSGGLTPLHFGCSYGHTEVVIQLLSAGATADQTSAGGTTPLHLACQNGHPDVVVQLLSAGVAINLATNSGSTPLHIACQNGHTEVVAQLLSAGAAVNQTSARGATPLHDACVNGHPEVVTQLLSAGAAVNQTANGGATPLHLACVNGDPEVVAKLLPASGVNLAAKASLNIPIEGAVARLPRIYVVKFMARMNELPGGLVNLPMPSDTPLCIANYYSHSSVIKILAPHVLNLCMQTQLEQSAQQLEKSGARYTNGHARLYGLFGARTDCFSIYQAAFVLNEYIHGRVEKSALDKHCSAYRCNEELKIIYDYYLSHPEMIERKPAYKIGEILKSYFEAKRLHKLDEAGALEKQIINIFSSDKDSLEAYIALAFIRMEKIDEKDVLSQLKFEGTLLSVRALDPDFSQTKNILSTWLDENSISFRKVDLLWQNVNGIKSEETSVVSSNDKGKEEEDNFSPTFKM